MDQTKSAFSRGLLAVITVALVLRIIAVVFSQGYMAHDDHFETINIAYSWHTQGLFEADEYLSWEGASKGGILRAATYNLFLLGLMKLTSLIGVEGLQAHMYFNRLIHALLSLLPIIFGYRYLRETTNEETAAWGGLLLAAFFLMPFLGARNLVEMVSGNLLLPGLYFAYRAVASKAPEVKGSIFGVSGLGAATLAGILCGLAMMIRYQTGAAVIAVPIAMVVVGRHWREASAFSLGVVWMMLVQALIDIYTHGYFWGSFINIVSSTGPTAVAGPWYRYILLLLGILIPPASVLLLGSLFQPQVVRKHIVLWLPLITFLMIHSAITEKQERFLIPVLPLLLTLVAVGFFYLYTEASWFRRATWLRRSLLVWFAVVNLVALPVFTVNYGKRGLVESMNFLAEKPDSDRVLFLSPERHTHFPFSYWSADRGGATTLQSRNDLVDSLAKMSSASALPRYAMIVTDDSLDVYLSLLARHGAEYEPVFYSGPSLVDLIANKLNPKYNRRNESWVVKRASEQR